MANFRDMLTLAADRARQAARVIRNGVPLERQATPDHWGGWRPVRTSGVAAGLTPGRVAAMLREAEDGYPMRMCELLEEIEDRDTDIVSALGTRKRAVANLLWEIKPVDDRRRSRRVAEFVKGRLNAIDNLEDGLIHLLDAISKGYAMVDIDWYNRASEVGIVKLNYAPQRWFRPDPEDPMTWRLLDAADPMGVPLVPYRYAIHTSLAKSGFPVKAGLGRVLTWWYLFKNYAVKDWVAYGELFGAPLRLGKYQAGAKPGDIEALRAAVQQLGVDASAVIEQSMQIEFIGDKSTRSGPEVYEKLVNLCDRGIAKAVLGQTLTTSEGASGSRALGQVHDGVRQDLKFADARQLGRTLTRDIVKPMVQWQFGPDEPIPSWLFDTAPPADAKATAEAQGARAAVFIRARQLGVQVPLAQVQLELAIRLPEGNEPLLPPLTVDSTDPSSTPEKAAAGAETAARARVPGPSLFAERTPAPPAMAEVEAAASHFLEDRGAPAWKTLIDSVRDRLSGARSVEEVPGILLDLAERFELEPFAGAISDAALTGEMMGRIQAQNGEVPVGEIPKVPPREAAEFWSTKATMTPREFYALADAARARAFTISGFTAASALGEAKEHLDDIIRNGGTMADFEDGLDGVYRKAGMLPLSPSRLQTVFDTNVFTAYGVGRYRQMTRPEALAARPYFRYRTLEDANVRPTHARMNGVVYPADHPFWDTWWPPCGYACRCHATAHSEGEVRTNGWRVLSTLPADVATGRPLLPDQGFQSNPAKEPHEFDWSRFPPEWRKALRVEAA